MNKKELAIQRKTIWRAYHVPGRGNYTTRPINAILFSPSNTWEHEEAKAHICYRLLKEKKKFITECVDNKTNERADIVCLDTGERFEIERDPRRAKRFLGKDVTVIKLWEENPTNSI